MNHSAHTTQQPTRYWTMARLAVAVLMVGSVTGITGYYAGNDIAALAGIRQVAGRGGGPAFGQGKPSGLLSQFDLSNLLLDEKQIRGGGPPKDGIPALVNPPAVTIDQADFMLDQYRVVGLTVNGQSRAYPINLLNWHECINDSLGDVPVAVIYCPLCDSVSVVDRRLEGKTYEFGISGLLCNSNVLLYDRTDQALWSQVGLKAVSGPNSGKSLKHLDGWQLTNFGDWKKTHPDSTILTFNTGHPRNAPRNYHRNPYAAYFANDSLMFPVSPLDDRLPAKTPIIGVRVAEQTRAYPTKIIAAAADGIVHDRLGGVDIELRVDPSTGRIEVSSVSGATVVHTFWFAWAAFHQQTDIYGPAPATQPADDS